MLPTATDPTMPLGEPRPASIPATLADFIVRVSSWDQVGLGTLSLLLFGAGLVPLELQRRIINEAVVGGTAKAIVSLALLYGAVAAGAGLLKLGLNIYRGYVSEGAVRWLREALLNDLCCLKPEGSPESDGVKVWLVLAEAEPVGAFVGVSVSEPLLQGGIVAGTFAYMLFLNPLMAALAFGVFSPQLVFVPLMQQAINRRVTRRTAALRRISGGVIAREREGDQSERITQVFALDVGIFQIKFSMNFLMNMMHHLGIAATLGLGGYYVVEGRAEIGTVVAFISGLRQLNDPWGDLVSWFRDLKVTHTKYALIIQALASLRTGATGPSITQPVPA